MRRNVYNDAFNITHDNHYFATINGLRLGRLSSPVVEWPEINAAWGQTCLLLATLAERLGYRFQGYELHPTGSTSTISRLEARDAGPGGADGLSRPAGSGARAANVARHRLELYSTGDLPLGLSFLHRRFDAAMVAFLECLRQLGDFVEHSSGGGGGGVGALKMPYEIKKDRIHDQSIRLSLNKEESWTKACKYTLTCCKYLLAHANKVDSPSTRRAK